MAAATIAPAAPRVGALDSLRLLAALLVVVQHLFETGDGWIARHIVPFEPGVAGVAVFFFISGYAIALAPDRKAGPRAFLLRRLLRLYPLYLAVLALLLWLGPAGVLPKWSFMAEATPLQWLANLALVQEFTGQRAFLGVSWTLIIELGFYALFAAALWGVAPGDLDRVMLAVPAALLALALLSLAIGVRVPLGRPMMIGAAFVGWQCRRWHGGDIDAAALRHVLLLFAVAATVAAVVGFGRFRHVRLDLAQVLLPWALAMSVFLLVMLRLRDVPLLASGILPLLGGFSYGVYLLHPLAIEAARVHFPAVAVPAALLITALLAWAGNRVVERPGMALGRRLASPRRVVLP